MLIIISIPILIPILVIPAHVHAAELLRQAAAEVRLHALPHVLVEVPHRLAVDGDALGRVVVTYSMLTCNNFILWYNTIYIV